MIELDDDLKPERGIPQVRDLCQKLGFGTNLTHSRPFRKELIQWRQNYRSFTTWESWTDRHDLGVVALQYLETDGNGRKYWPSNGSASPRPVYEYPKDIKKYVYRLLLRHRRRKLMFTGLANISEGCCGDKL